MPDRLIRIAVIQHGDYRDALNTVGSGRPETYFGMSYSVTILEDLLASRPHLLICLNAPPYAMERPNGSILGLPCPRLPRYLPGTLGLLLWAKQIEKELEAFRPTHVLLRSGIPILGTTVLSYCARQGASALVIMAGMMGGLPGRLNRHYLRRFVRLLNHPCVFRVGNHKIPASRSTIECGVKPDKVSAWDWPGLRNPREYSAKRYLPGERAEIVYVGAVDEDKGVFELVEAVHLLEQRGLKVGLTLLGDGPAVPDVRRLAARLGPQHAQIPGRVGNDAAFSAMLRATLVCVPSRHCFAEGMPLSLTEALASRTPVIASDHPVFTSAFQDGEGIRFFKERDPASLAAAAEAVLTSPQQYEQLSRTTLEAFGRVECKTVFGDLIEEWRRTFDGPPTTPETTGQRSYAPMS